MRPAAASTIIGLGAMLLNACASEPAPQPDLSGAPEGPSGAPPSSGAGLSQGPAGGRMRPLFISPAGQPFHGAPDGPPPMTLWFAQADADHDGKLTLKEMTGDFERFFRQLDTNGDGVIDGFESQAYERSVAPELLPQVGRLRAGEGQDERLFKAGRSGGAGRGGGRGSRRGEPAAGAGRPSGGEQTAGAYQLFPDLEPVTAADADLDGRVTLAEWRLRASAVFRQLDSETLGFLTLATMPKTPQQLAIEKRKAAQDKRRLP